MELNERKMRILQAIISSYIDTAEPVGSRTISKNFDLGISPATIRNEMSDLEDLGFIVQPHTSSGRIPSDKGYRLYVDLLLENQKAETKRISLLEDLMMRTDRIENLLQDIARLLAQETHYASIVTTPQYNKSKIKNIQLIGLENSKLLTVIVTDNDMVKNYMMDMNVAVEQNVLNRLSYILNEHLYGLTLQQINLPLIQSMKEYAKQYEEVVTKVLDAVFRTIQEMDDTRFYTSGTTNILKLPEFSDINKAMELIDTFEEKESLKHILDNPEKSFAGDINIKIGEEIDIEEMKDCSIITTTYSIGKDTYGTIGIIGPKRMDYMCTITALKNLIGNMEKKVKRDKGS